MLRKLKLLFQSHVKQAQQEYCPPAKVQDLVLLPNNWWQNIFPASWSWPNQKEVAANALKAEKKRQQPLQKRTVLVKRIGRHRSHSHESRAMRTCPNTASDHPRPTGSAPARKPARIMAAIVGCTATWWLPTTQAPTCMPGDMMTQ
jgi:hypothetical protein